jgi:hypothetical protein
MSPIVVAVVLVVVPLSIITICVTEVDRYARRRRGKDK